MLKSAFGGLRSKSSKLITMAWARGKAVKMQGAQAKIQKAWHCSCGLFTGKLCSLGQSFLLAKPQTPYLYRKTLPGGFLWSFSALSTCAL